MSAELQHYATMFSTITITFCYRHLETSPSRPSTELKHTKAPSGDMYTVIDKIPTKSMDNEVCTYIHTGTVT